MQRTYGAFGIIVSRGMCADWAIHDSENEKGEKMPVIDKKKGWQKVDKRNRKQWKCHQ